MQPGALAFIKKTVVPFLIPQSDSGQSASHPIFDVPICRRNPAERPKTRWINDGLELFSIGTPVIAIF